MKQNKENLKRILVIDDDPSMRAALKEALKLSGWEAVLASNGREGLDLFRKKPAQLVITDVRMEGMSGIEVLAEIKKDSDVPVIVITAFGTIEDAVDAMKRGAVDYILKPFSFDDLQNIVNNAFLRLGAAPMPAEGAEGMGRDLVGTSPAFQEMLSLCDSIASSRCTVLIQGKSGTGKELVSRYIHFKSPRQSNPFVAVNCAAIPENLLESELFGHERGAFTGASTQKTGKFELANGGTLLLDEISEMPKLLQAKLLRVLQEFEIDRVGGRAPVPVDVRVLATTNADLRQRVREGAFREDLFYRLNVIRVEVPDLRERKEDIQALADHFLMKYTVENRRNITGFSEAALQKLTAYSWPGNVRELENVVERAVLISRGSLINPDAIVLDDGMVLNQSVKDLDISAGQSVRDVEKLLILKTLKEVGGNRTKAAGMLGISIRTLRNKLSEYKQDPDFPTHWESSEYE